MKALVSIVLLIAVCHGRSLGQSFTQTIGGLSSEVGIGASPAGDGYRVSVREYDRPSSHHSGSIYTMSGTGGFLSASPLILDGDVFLQDHVNATDGSAFLIGSLIPTDGTDQDGLIVKLNADGNVVWMTQPSVSGAQEYLGGAALPDGGSVVCGISRTDGAHEVLVTRLDANGAVVWNHVEPSATDAEAHALVVEGSTVMITGRQKTFGGTDDVLFLRMDLDGTVIWTTSRGGSANEEGRAIITTGDGVFISGGWTNSYGTFDESSLRIPYHAYLIAIDLDGDTLWTRAVGDTLFDRHAYAMEAAPNGDLLLAGERSTSGSSDALLIRVAPDGTPIWERSIDTGKEERIVHLLPLADGMIGTGRSFGEFSDQLFFIRRNAEGF